jgi:hypothetical protein
MEALDFGISIKGFKEYKSNWLIKFYSNAKIVKD